MDAPEIRGAPPADAGDLMVEPVSDAVFCGIFRKGNRHHEGIHDAAVLRKHGKLADNPGYQGMELLFVDHDKAFDTVCLSLLHDLMEAVPVFLRAADKDLAAAPEGKAKFPGEAVHAFIPLNTQLCLQASGIIGKASVADTGVSPARLVANVQVLLEHADPERIAGELSCDGGPDHTAADDHDIILIHPNPSR